MSDRAHFEEYRAQTLVKHQILEKYIFAYFNILKATDNKNLVYIDGFAGPGHYSNEQGEMFPGSPIRALTTIARKSEVAQKVTTIFIEKDPELYASLQSALNDFYSRHSEMRQPQYSNGAFAEIITKLLDSIRPGTTLAPAFVFVDPCGVDGVDFAVLERILKAQSKAELFLFFNIDGVKRILGLRDRMGATMTRLLGSEARARELLKIVESRATPAERERAIIDYYSNLLRTATPAKFVVDFRVEKEDKRSTSHYLVHASQHALGFGIMKDVMWSVGQTAEGSGGLSFEQASVLPMKMLFTPSWETLKRSILTELKPGMRQASYFTQVIATRPDNRSCAKAYKLALLELEHDGEIVVYDKQGRQPAPTRLRRHGKLTLADDFHVTLKP